jgi:uncharacterized protein (TIGR02996 family)
MTEADLLAGIVAHPLQAERWLILADWLEDQQDPRTELVRLRWQYHHEQEHPDFETRRQRLVDLWAGGLAPLVPTLTNSIGMSFVLIPPGSFWMGRPYGANDQFHHRVTLTEPFFLGRYPVTVGEFKLFLEETGHKPAARSSSEAGTWDAPGFQQSDRHPVVFVDWKDAQAMAAWLTRKEKGMVYSLPTEAQWEYACRAGTATMYFWGDDADRLGEYAWFQENSGKETHPVETKKPNPWGLWQMPGNVWEWCQDWYDDYTEGDARDPKGAARGTFRVLRGGGWLNDSSFFRSAYRVRNYPSFRRASYGFRLAATLK